MMKSIKTQIVCLSAVFVFSFSSVGVAGTTNLPSEMEGKLFVGYQGWFRTPADGANSKWKHWGNGTTLSATDLTVDMWPDISEYPDTVLATPPGLPLLGNGTSTKLFSSIYQETTDLHLKWMQDYGVDGAFVQRFVTDFRSPKSEVPLLNMVNNGGRFGVKIAIMYDISAAWRNSACYVDGGAPDTSLGSANPKFSIKKCVSEDWLVLESRLINSNGYLRVFGSKPLVGLWGYGFNPGVSSENGSQYLFNTADGLELINWFKSRGIAVMGGIPTYWRTQTRDSLSDAYAVSRGWPSWSTVYSSFDILSPWMVGRVANSTDVDNFASATLLGDIQAVQGMWKGYLPVIYPGFSFFNTARTRGSSVPLNQIPRNYGSFYWKQFDAYKKLGLTSMYVAMFDEVDEGTAIFKIAPTHSTTPQGASMVALNADGQSLPSDWYLQVSRHMSGVLKGGTISLPRNFTLRAGETKQGVGAKLVYQTDGNLAVYDPVGTTLWAASTQSPEVIRSCSSGCQMVFQGDGNLVLYDNGTPYWATATSDAQLGATNVVTQLVLSYQSPFLLLKNPWGSNLWTTTSGVAWQSNQDTTPPTVSFNSPSAGTSFTTPQTVTISVTAMDNTGLSKLELRRNGSLAKTFTAGPYTYSWPVSASLNGSHAWTATATDVAGLATTVSLTCSVNIDLTAPTVPAGLVGVGKNQSLTFTWTPSTDTGGSGVKGYEVSVSTLSTFAVGVPGWINKDVGNVTSVSLSGLAPNTAYYARVRALDNTGNVSPYGPYATAKTLPDTEPPTAPTVTGKIEGFSLVLSWTAGTDFGGSGLARYEVDVSTASDFSSYLNPWQKRDLGLAVSTSVANVSFGQTYYARVRSVDGAGNRTQSVPISVSATRINNPGFEDFSVDASVPDRWDQTASAGTPTALVRSPQAGDFNSGSAGLKITVLPSITQVAYQPWTNYQPNKTYRLTFWGKVVSSTDTMTGYADVISRFANGTYKGLLAGVRFTLPEWTKYSVTFATDTIPERPLELRAFHIRSDLPGTIHFDDFSIEEIDRPTAPPGLPGPLTVIPAQGSLSVSWGASNGTPVDFYRLFISTRNDFAVHVPGWNSQNVGDRTSINVSGLKEKTTYYVRLRAFNAVGGYSGYTPTVSATTLGDVTPPAAPPSLTATWLGGGRARLAWDASVDNVGVTQYVLDRCVGAGCSNFVQIATLPVVGTVTGVDTTMFPDRLTLLWTGRTQFKNVSQNQKISVQGSTYALNDDSGVGNLYVIKSAAVTVGDSLAFLSPLATIENALASATEYRYRLRAQDAEGNLGDYSSVVVLTTPDVTPPTVSLAGPAEGSTVRGTVALSATASDNVGVNAVVFAINGVARATDTAAPYQYNWDTSVEPPNKPYTITARASDAAGNSVLSSSITVTVLDGSPPNAPPSLAAALMGNGKARLAWDASVDNVGVTQYSLERCGGTGCSNFVQIATLPVVGTVTGVDTVMFPDRITLLWTGRSQFKNVTQNQKISVQGTTYTLTGDSGVGNLYLIKTATVSVGDSLAFLTPLATVDYTLASATEYRYRLRAQDDAGNLGAYSPVAVVTPAPTTTAAIQMTDDVPRTVDGARAYPVPFRPGQGAVGITFDRLPDETRITIGNSTGEPVRDMIAGGTGRVLWDLLDNAGAPVPSGVYMVNFEGGGTRKSTRVIVQK